MEIDNYFFFQERASILLDLYLNTPDKAINETPLHFAVKFGAKDVVDLLVSYPQCNKNRTNKFGGQPKDVFPIFLLFIFIYILMCIKNIFLIVYR